MNIFQFILAIFLSLTQAAAYASFSEYGTDVYGNANSAGSSTWGDGSPRSNGFSSNYRQDNSDVVRRYNHEIRTRNYPRI